MGFFEQLNAVCEAQNQHLDQMLEKQQADAAANQAREAAEEQLRRRNWAVGVLEAGNMPLEKRDRISAAMMIVTADQEIPCSKVEQLLLKHEQYRPIIYQAVIEKFLERGGDPAGKLGVYCIQCALALEPGSDLFRGDVAQSLAMGLLILGCFNGEKRPEIVKVQQTLRRMFPFTKGGNLQNIPHGLAMKLYPEQYDAEGRCKYRFASRFETGEPRKVATHKQGKLRSRYGEEKPEETDPEILAGMAAAASGQLQNIRLIRAS